MTRSPRPAVRPERGLGGSGSVRGHSRRYAAVAASMPTPRMPLDVGEPDGVGVAAASAVHVYRGAVGSKPAAGEQVYATPDGSVYVQPAGGDPLVPSLPGAPSVPSLPGAPSTPATPWSPLGPGTVESAPGAPAAPVGPGTVESAPGEPARPAGPDGPTTAGPGSPRLPGGPATGEAPRPCTC